MKNETENGRTSQHTTQQKKHIKYRINQEKQNKQKKEPEEQ